MELGKETLGGYYWFRLQFLLLLMFEKNLFPQRMGEISLPIEIQRKHDFQKPSHKEYSVILKLTIAFYLNVSVKQPPLVFPRHSNLEVGRVKTGPFHSERDLLKAARCVAVEFIKVMQFTGWKELKDGLACQSVQGPVCRPGSMAEQLGYRVWEMGMDRQARWSS